MAPSAFPDPFPAMAAPSQGVFGISVAAELVGMGPQTLRLYESRGLVEPERTAGGTRRYSSVDLARLQRIGELLGAGLNLAGVAMVLELEAANAALQEQLDAVDRLPPSGGSLDEGSTS